MRNLLKITISLVLLLAFVLLCFGTFILFSFGAWLHTYRTFTQKDLVAVIEVEGIKTDDEGLKYTEVKYKPVKDQSALTRIFTARENKDDEFEGEHDYKIYGDRFEVGGDYVKFADYWNLFGIKNIYKVTRLEGDYADASMDKNLPNEKRTVYDINGGTDSYWKYLQENTKRFNFLVDSVYGNYTSKFVPSEKNTYGLYVTEDGFILDEY